MLSRHDAYQWSPAVVAGPAAESPICELLAERGCHETSAETDAQLLRTLATLCCVEDCLVQLQQVTLLYSVINGSLKLFAVCIY